MKMFLANNDYTFQCKVKGDRTSEWFEGTFTVKCILNTEEQIEIGLRTDRYNQGSKTLSPAFTLLNRTIAELEVRISRNKEGKIQAPTWWMESDSGRLLYDTNVIYHVFTEAMKAENVFQERLKTKADEAEKKAKDEKSEVSNAR